MATVVVGDVHGNAAALEDLLRTLGSVLEPADTLVFLGDYVDDGPEVRSCIDLILDARARGPATVVGLLGNHEQWMLECLRDPTRRSWLLGMNGLGTVESYSREAADTLRAELHAAGPRLLGGRPSLSYALFFAAVPPAHREFFGSLERRHRGADVLCVHGGYDAAAGDDQDYVWGPDRFPESYAGTEPVVYGHRNNAVVDPEGWPHPRVTRDVAFGIDTIRHGVLTAMRFPDRTVFQSARHVV